MPVKLLNTLFNPFSLDIKILSLKFKEKEIETEFTEDYKTKNDAFTLIFTLLSTCLFVIFYLIYDLEHPIWFIIMFFLSLAFGVGLFFKIFRKFYYLAIFVFSAIIVISYLQRMHLYDNHDRIGLSEYLMGLILIIFVTNSFLHLLFRHAVISNLLFFAVLIYISYFKLELYDANPGFFIYSTIVILTVLIVISFLIFNFEYIYRDSFLKEKKVQQQAEELKLAKENIEQKVIERTRELDQEKIKKQKAMIVGQQMERERIAKDLHDSMTINLIVIKRKMELMPDNSEIIAGIDKSIDQLRNISHNLLPYSLIHYGLLKATEELCLNVKTDSMLNVSMSKTGISENMRWESSIEIELFKVLQELMANCIKHSKAKNILIDMIADEETINISVEDDGIGFNINENPLSRFGLNNMEARICLLGGTISFDSRPGKGTIVMINLPI